MGILNSLREVQISAATKSSSHHPGDPALVEMLGGGMRTSSGQNVTPDTALRLAAVYAAVRRLSEGVGMLPLDLFRHLDEDKKEKAKNLQLYQLLHTQPNAFQTSMEFREYCMAGLLLRGNAYAYKQMTRSGFIESLNPLPPDNIRQFWVNRRRGQMAYRYTDPDSGGQEIFLPGEIFHLRGLSVNGGLSGLNPIEYHRETVGLGLAMQEYGAKFYANAATPSGILEHPSHFRDAEKRKEFRLSFIEQTTGSDRHAPVVLEDNIKFTALGINQKDAQYVEGRKLSVTDIARMFLVPPHMIGDLERATFSNITQMSLEFVIYSLMPWFVRWEQSAARDLFITRDEKESLFIKFNANGLLRGDIKTRFEAYRMGILDGHMTRNEVRLLEDLNPGPEELDEYLQPSNMAEAGETGSNTEEPTNKREQQLTEAAAKRIVNKEYKAVHKLFEKNTTPAARKTAFAGFYQEHEKFVADVLGVADKDAADYCARSIERWHDYIEAEGDVSGRFENVQYHQLLITAALAAH